MWTAIFNSNDFVGGSDYTPGLYPVTFSAGETSASFKISITDDDIVERDELFNLIIDTNSLPNDVTVGNPGNSTVTILNDDCEYYVTLS